MFLVELVVVEGTDERMVLEEVHLDDVGGLIEQAFEILESPDGVMGGDGGGFFELINRVTTGQIEQALHDPQTGFAFVVVHAFSPGTGVGTDDAALIEQVIDAALNDATFAAVQVGGIGGESAGFSLGVQGDLLRMRMRRVSSRNQTCWPRYSGGTE